MSGVSFRGLAAAWVIATASSAWAQVTPLAEMSCTSANFPDCNGWGPVSVNPYFSRRFVSGGGPQGQNAVELSQNPADHHAQYYLGWWGPVLPSPPQGTTRYLRMRFKTVGSVNLQGVSDVWTDKFVILADGDNPTGRVICHLRDDGVTSNNLGIFCSRNIDGYPNATPGVSLPSDTWVSLQMEFKSSTTTSSGDGSLKIWKNSNAYASPTVQSGQFQLDAINWGRISVGFYANATLGSSGRLVFQLADVEFDDEFDPIYHQTGGTPTPPRAPNNLRRR
ncbi:MAG: hypothetical protein ACKVPX_02485 [Myxococcaceae bacterium]